MGERGSQRSQVRTPDTSCSINQFLKALSSAQPAPGGGAAAAVAGAMGAALGGMVGRIVSGRWGQNARLKPQIRKAVRTLDRLQRYFERSVQKDAAAYTALMAALNRPGSSPAQKRRAVERAIAVPLGICEAAVEALEQLKLLDKSAGPYLKADLKAAGALLKAAFEAAAEMVEINLKTVPGTG